MSPPTYASALMADFLGMPPFLISHKRRPRELASSYRKKPHPRSLQQQYSILQVILRSGLENPLMTWQWDPLFGKAPPAQCIRLERGVRCGGLD
eukprot:scaffold25881_cov129-Isochrysis_galbana.AAC.3